MTGKKRKILWWLGGIVVGLLLLVALLPTIASTALGRNIAVSTINKGIGGKVALKSWKLSWFNGQELKGLTLTDPEGKPVLNVPEVTSDASLAQLLFGGRGIGTTIAKKPIIELRGDSLERSLFKPGTHKASASPALVAFPLLAGRIEIQEGTIHIINPDGSRTTITPLNFDLSVPKETNAISMKVSSNDIVGDLHVTQDLAFEGHLRATHFPLALLDVALAYTSAEEFSVLTESLGSTAVLKVNAQGAQGEPTHFTVEAAAKHGSLNFDGQIADGVLTLNKPFEARLQVTPEASRLLLAKVNPLLGTAMRSERPILLKIDPEGFRLKGSDLTIARATLDAGKLWLANTGQVKQLVELFPGSSLAPEPEILAWPTPVYASLKDGIVKIERTDMLLGDELQVASWGKIDLHHETLDMKLAIPGYSLRKMLRADIVDNDDYLVIPVKGRFDKIKVGWEKVAAQVAALVTKAQSGHFVGALAKIALDAKVKVPPPTTQPFPWGQPPEEGDVPTKIKKKAIKELKKHLGL